MTDDLGIKIGIISMLFMWLGLIGAVMSTAVGWALNWRNMMPLIFAYFFLSIMAMSLLGGVIGILMLIYGMWF